MPDGGANFPRTWKGRGNGGRGNYRRGGRRGGWRSTTYSGFNKNSSYSGFRQKRRRNSRIIQKADRQLQTRVTRKKETVF